MQESAFNNLMSEVSYHGVLVIQTTPSTMWEGFIEGSDSRKHGSLETAED
jgi:hypothetical protein